MKLLKNKVLPFFAFSACCALLMNACGDSGNSSNANGSSSVEQYESLNKVPDCTGVNEDKVVFVSDGIEFYICKDGSWIVYDRDLYGENSFSGYDAKKQRLTDVRDSQVYKTVTIGSQIWMAQNLNYRYDPKGDGTDSLSFCFDNDPVNCKKYGRLYLWSAAVDSAAVFSKGARGCGDSRTCNMTETVQGICPSGWHLPSLDEWIELLDYVVGSRYAGQVLKDSSWDGEDEFGFAVLPAGIREDGDFPNYEIAEFWTSTERDAFEAAAAFFRDEGSYVEMSSELKESGFSVRCLKNTTAEILSSSQTSGESSSGMSSSSGNYSSQSSSSGNDIVTPSSSSSYEFYYSSYSIEDYDLTSSLDVLNSAADYGEFTDERDGQVYKTVTIGNQVWMAQNLNYNYYKGSARSYCYDGDYDNCDVFGRLYTWSAAVDSAALFSKDCEKCGFYGVYAPTARIRGVCPEGWHLPHNSEWYELYSAIGGSDDAGTLLKSLVGWVDDKNGTDKYGFAAIPGGYRDSDGDYGKIGEYGHYWTAGEHSRSDGDYVYFDEESSDVSSYGMYKSYAYSVRCVNDTLIAESSSSSDEEMSSSSEIEESSSSEEIESSSSDENESSSSEEIESSSSEEEIECSSSEETDE